MTGTMTNGYMKLQKRFALRPIQDEEQCKLASEVLVEIGMKGDSAMSADELDYVTVLSRLVSDFEETIPGIREMRNDLQKIDSRELLKSLMEDNGLTQVELASDVGTTQSVISDFLNGRRGLSKVVALKLAGRFKLAGDTFIK